MVVHDLAYHVLGLKTECLWVTLTSIPSLHTLWSVDDGTAGNPQWPVYSKMIKLAVFPVTQKVILEPEIPLIPGNSPLPPAPSLKNLTLCIYDIIFAPFINL